MSPWLIKSLSQIDLFLESKDVLVCKIGFTLKTTKTTLSQLQKVARIK